MKKYKVTAWYWTFGTGGITTTCWFILLILKINDFKKNKNNKRV